MPTALSYAVDSRRRWRRQQLEAARRLFLDGNIKAARQCLRTATVLSFRRREALRELRAGHVYERSNTTPEDAKVLDDFLELHRRRFV